MSPPVSEKQLANPPAWGPLQQPLFRALWIASLASNIGGWMQDVGSAWHMTSLTSSPLLVALVTTADNLPILLLALPAGALADVVDRRRLLIFAQTVMLVAAGTLGILVLAHATTPWRLLALTFVIGIGAALNGPTWQAIIPELVDRSELRTAAALSSVGFNLARAVGPALAGLVVAAAGPGIAFLLNAASFFWVIIVLYRWRRTPRESVAPAERVLEAARAGLRYVRHAPALHPILLRTGAFVVCGSALWAVLPLIARQELGLGSAGYGVLLGCLGTGAVAGASVLPRVRARLSVDQLIAAATMLYAGVVLVLASVHVFGWLCAAMFVGGTAWVTLMSSFSAAAQLVLPSWVRARALAVYLLVSQGGMALGSVLWGAAAERVGIPMALIGSAAGLILGLLATSRYRLAESEGLDLTLAPRWPDPLVVDEPDPEVGPVLVTVEYQIDPARAADFARAMQGVRLLRRRDGAYRWGLFRDTADPSHYHESFLIETWAEHLRQHERLSVADHEIEDRARAFHVGDEPPTVTHFVAQQAPETG